MNWIPNNNENNTLYVVKYIEETFKDKSIFAIWTQASFIIPKIIKYQNVLGVTQGNNPKLTYVTAQDYFMSKEYRTYEIEKIHEINYISKNYVLMKGHNIIATNNKEILQKFFLKLFKEKEQLAIELLNDFNNTTKYERFQTSFWMCMLNNQPKIVQNNYKIFLDQLKKI